LSTVGNFLFTSTSTELFLLLPGTTLDPPLSLQK
jgi:hypothetical protein